MRGKWVAIILGVAALAAGAGAYYAQNYAYYTVTEMPDGLEPGIAISLRDGQVLPVQVARYRQLDSTSSPIRWRSCFDLGKLPDDAMPYIDPQPLIGPFWFECYDAAEVAQALETGAAHAYLGTAEIRPDVDRVIVRWPDGRAVGWHQLNDKTPERGVMD